MRLKLILGVFVVVALVVAGCGSSDSTSSGGSGTASSGSTDGTTTSSTDGTTASSGKPLTKEEFSAEAEKICQGIPAAYNEKLEAAEKANKGKKPLSTAEQNLKAAVPPLHTAVEEFEALTPPKGEEKLNEEIVASLEVAAKGMEAKPESELSGPKSPYNEFQEVTKKAKLTSCEGL